MKGIIFVVCDTTYQAKALMKDALKQLKKPPLAFSFPKAIFETDEYEFRFISKYDINGPKVQGIRPSDVLTYYEFEQLIFGAYK